MRKPASLFLQSQSTSPPLRIGLLLDTAKMESCFAEALDQIQHCSFGRLELVVYNSETQEKPAEPQPRRSIFGKVLALLRDPRRRRILLFSLYQRWDARNRVPSEDPETPIDCSARLEHVDSFSVTPIRKRFVHRFPADAVERIRDKHLDVLIRFGFNILRGEILTAARCGVWSYHHGDVDSYRGGPPYFWEVYERNPISGAMLQVLTEELDAGKVLCKGWFATCPGISRVRNCVGPYWGASTFLIQMLRELHWKGWEHIERSFQPLAPYRGKRKIYTAPSNFEMLKWLGPLLVDKAARKLVRRAAIKHWRLAARFGSRAIGDPGGTPDPAGFTFLESPKGRFYADPFLMEDNGKVWLFFEDYDYNTKRGRISCAEVREGGMSQATPVVERPYHLSYPCIFRAEGSVYMIPESAANNTVELYRCTRFPDKWEFEKELYSAQAVDTTVWVQDGLYWFFTTMQESRGYATQLWLFYATTLTGKWTPHPANPISTDVRNCRGAGAIFRRNGKLFRPSQDCSSNYGYSFALNEILVLERNRYEERPGATMNPLWAPGLVGTHTYSHAGQVEIIDGCAPLPVAKVLNLK